MTWAKYLTVTIAVLLTAVFAAAPVAADYRIGPDDQLAVSLWDNRDVDLVVAVRPDGKISLPLVGEVQAGGLTVNELTASLTTAYRRFVEQAHVTVMVKEIKSRTVYFVGGVAKPGPYQLNRELTLLQAISVAGGLTSIADLESSFVLRGKEKIPVDFIKLLQQGDVSQNVVLAPGDTIVVPVAEVVYVQGEVKNPGIVKFDSELTLVSAIAKAGGFTPLAARNRVNLLRNSEEEKQSVQIDVREIMSRPDAVSDVHLKPRDILIVPQRLF
ncbi:MAG: SLBB domain-containing protein [Candidatus Rokubacteria bacterium]|nr:SLBB domain-containing protein [Candidatus Rokubacteria bacterium]